MNEYRTLLEDILPELLAIPTAPFSEGRMLAFIRGFADDLGLEYSQDDIGNLIVTVGSGEDSTLAIEAHVDHPGFLIAEDSDGPNVNALFYGWVEEEYFKDEKVVIFTETGQVNGRVVSTDFTQAKEQVKKAVLEIDSSVSKGDFCMWALGEYRVAGDRLHSRALDDLAGCGAILTLMKLSNEHPGLKTFKAIFTVSEEAGLNGAKYLAANSSLSKDVNVITVETSSLLAGAPVGDGAVIRVGDRLSVFDNGLLSFMETIAKEIAACDKDFKYQRKLMDGGVCESTVYQKFGLRTAALCVPLGNYHNRDFDNKKIAEEYIDLNDLAGLVQLFEHMLQNADRIEEFVNPSPPKIVEESRSVGERFIKTK